MDNSATPAPEHGGEKLDRREFLRKAALGTLAVATVSGVSVMAREVLAQEITPVAAEDPVFEYRESELGIDYRAVAPNPLDAILSQGEEEWMQNAQTDYEEDTAGAWAEEMVPEIATGAISESTIDEMRTYTPQMLQKFAAGLDPQDPKYGGLWSVGNLFVAEQLAGKA